MNDVRQVREWAIETRDALRDVVERLDAGEIGGAERVAGIDLVQHQLAGALHRLDGAVAALHERREVGDGEGFDPTELEDGLQFGDNDDDDGAEVCS